MSELRVVCHEPEPQRSRGASSPVFPYVKIIVDGEDLRAIVGGGHAVQEVGPPQETALQPSMHLLGEPDPDLRADADPFVLVCQLDADPYCGGVTARIEVNADEVTWCDFNRVWFDSEEATWVRDPISVGPFFFDRDAYAAALGFDLTS